MTLFDIRSLSLLTLFSSLLLAAAMLLIGRIYRDTPAIRLWKLGAAQASTGFLLIALRNLLPEAASVVLANTLLATGLAWLLFGLRIALGLPRGPRWDVAAAAVIVPSFAYFSLVAPDLAARILIISAVLSVIGLAATWLLLIAPAARQDVDRPVLVVLGLAWLTFTLIGLLRIVLTALAPTGGDFMVVTEPIHKLAFVAFLQLDIVLTFGLAYLVAVRTQRALRERDRKLEAIVGHSPSALSLKTPDGRYALANPNLQRIHHCSEANIVGKTDFDLYPEPVARRFRANDAQVMAARARCAFEEIIPVDGVERSFTSFMFPIFDAQGGIEYICRIALDITDRKRTEAELAAANARQLAEQQQARLATLGMMEDALAARDAAEKIAVALRASEARFHDIVNASADWVWEVDAAGRYTYASESVEQLLGYTPAEVIGKTPFDFMPPAEAARVGAEFAALVARKAPFRDLDNINVHKDGSLRHVWTNGMPMLAEDGALLGYRGLDRDITEKKLAELRLRESESRFRTLFDNASVGIFVHDIATGRIIDANHHGLEMFGYATFDQWSDKQFCDPPYSRADAELMIHKAVSAGPQRFEWLSRRVDGSVFWQEIQLEKIVISGTERVLAVTTDIQARKAAEAELRERNAELLRANKAMVGRELTMIEMKKTINALHAELGRAPPYPLDFLKNHDAPGTP